MSKAHELYLLATALTFCVSPAQAAILDHASFGQHMYFLLSPGTWHEKEAEAGQLGGHLVSINSHAENQFIYDRWIAERIVCVAVVGVECPPVWPPEPWSNPRVFEAWIGFTDAELEGAFAWVDGQPVTFTNWFLGPFDPSGSEDFALLTSGGKWVNVEGSRLFAAVAEVDVPEPSTFAYMFGMFPAVIAALWRGWPRHRAERGTDLNSGSVQITSTSHPCQSALVSHRRGK